jgi:hypothetical protein
MLVRFLISSRNVFTSSLFRIFFLLGSIVRKDGHRIKYYLENEDAAPCLEDKQCIGLGIEFGQFL